MTNIRLNEFPVKVTAVPSDIVYCGNSAAADDEVQITVAGLIGAYPGLLSIGGLTTVADRMLYTTGADTYDVAPITAFGRSLVADANAAAAQATLSLVPGTDVQAFSAALTSIAGLTTAADEMIYTTGADTYAVTSLTSAARTLLGETTTANMLTYLGALPLAGGTMSGVINMNSFAITNMADPTDPQDAATKNYVDNVATGLTVQPACYAATTANLAGYTYNNGVLGVGATLTAGSNGAFSVDGTSPAINSRILVKNQSTAAQNGIYTLTQVGDGSNPAILTRSTDYDQPSEINPGDFVIINNGTVNGGYAYVQTATVAIIGTDAINWSQFGGQFALKGANADITSMTGLTGALQAPTAIKSSAGLTAFEFTYVASAVNYIGVSNRTTSNYPYLYSTGSDSSVNFGLVTKNGNFFLVDSTSTIAPALQFRNAANTHYTALKVATAQATDLTLTLPAVDGINLDVLATNGSAVLAFQSPSIVQTQAVAFSPTSGTTTIPFDNTTPQITEGFSCGSLSITPTKAANTLEIEILLNANCSAAAQVLSVCLFQNGGSNAIAVSFGLSASNGGQCLVLRYRIIAGSTSSQTFAVRVGGNSATAVTVSGYAGAGIYNGTAIGLMTIREIRT